MFLSCRDFPCRYCEVCVSSELTGFVVGLSDSQAASITRSFVHCTLTNVLSLDVDSFRMRDDLDRPGCIVAALPTTPVEVRCFVEQLSAKHSPLAVIWVTEHADVPSVVEAIRRGAIDVLPWPVGENTLENALVKACRASSERQTHWVAVTEAQQKLARLSTRERDVLDLILAGKVNKFVASRLGIALRTVENRRKQIFTKLGTRSLAEIVHMVRTSQLEPAVALFDPAMTTPTTVDAPWDRAAG
jgi:two-component system response regulator DctR